MAGSSDAVGSTRTPGVTTAYPDDCSIAETFARWVATAPDAVAVSEQAHQVTYADLDEWSDRLAARLADSGVGVGEPVGLLGARSLEAIVGMLAIVKVGAAYVPLDRSDPVGRLRSLADVLALRRVVTVSGSEGILDRIPGFAVSDFRHGPTAEWRAVRLGGDDLAYIMFTSGSTGVPKAVAVPHRAVARLVVNTNYVDIRPADAVTHTGHLAFDASVFEVWGALLNGARVVVVDADTLLDPHRLELLLRESGVTVSWLSAGVFHHCARSRPAMFQGLRYLISGGDVLNPQLVRHVLAAGPPQNLINGYGPTENTTFSTTYRIVDAPAGTARIPIGRPVANSTCPHRCRRRNARAGRCGRGLWVGGDGVAAGYVNSPDLTAERFVADPVGRRPHARLFRTGDMAAWLPDGNIDFLGRRDRMIKFRDFRVELDEIEAVLARCPGVGEAAVITAGTGERVRAIVGFYVPAPAPVDGSPSGASTDRIRAFLAERLPHFMLPARLTAVDQFPLTGTGKVDRVALADLAARRLRARGTGAPGPTRADTDRGGAGAAVGRVPRRRRGRSGRRLLRVGRQLVGGGPGVRPAAGHVRHRRGTGALPDLAAARGLVAVGVRGGGGAGPRGHAGPRSGPRLQPGEPAGRRRSPRRGPAGGRTAATGRTRTSC